jgi:hypothetical protein
MRTAQIVYDMVGYTTVTITNVPNDWDTDKVLKEWREGNIEGDYEVEETDMDGACEVWLQ